VNGTFVEKIRAESWFVNGFRVCVFVEKERKTGEAMALLEHFGMVVARGNA